MTLKKIGPYKLEGILGRGGMGTVYRGLHTDTDQEHAIKVLAPRFADDQHFRGRFEAEIQALLKLDHENIVSLLSYGQDLGQLFFAMELVNGKSLFQMQKAGHKFNWRQVLNIARDCASGLRHAHDRGVIHRDLKPGNLMMADAVDDRPAQVKLTDFGIAKRFGSSQNTGTNILGTMDFMSPEQARGEPVTARSDLYSLGAVLFTLLAGKPPFSSNSVEESLRNLTNVPAPSVTISNPAVPKPIDDLIGKLMAKKPEARIATALVLLHKISDIENELRDDASAQTSHGQASSKKTKILSDDQATGLTPTDELTMSSGGHLGAAKTIGIVQGPTSEHRATSEHLPDSEHNEDLTLAPVDSDLGSEKKDYFNQVTDSLRRQHLEPTSTTPNRSRGLLPSMLALVGVIALLIYGVSRATAPKTAEQLFAEIELSNDEPNKVVEEIGLFLENYPDDPRASSLAELQSIGLAIKDFQAVKNTLTVRARAPGGLTDVEQKFLELANLAKEDERLAGEKMAAFALVHNAIALDERDMKCVQAAKSYNLKLNHELRVKAESTLGLIRNAFFSANQMENPREALEHNQSLLKLYSDTDFSALENPAQGTEVLGQIRSRVAELDNQVRMEALEAEKKELEKQKTESTNPEQNETTGDQNSKPNDDAADGAAENKSKAAVEDDSR